MRQRILLYPGYSMRAKEMSDPEIVAEMYTLFHTMLIGIVDKKDVHYENPACAIATVRISEEELTKLQEQFYQAFGRSLSCAPLSELLETK